MSAYLGGTSTNEAPARKAVTLPSLLAMRAAGEKIAMLTCYDASFASLMDRCGVDILLIGDSLGMVCAGYDSTLPVTVADVAYHTASVVRGRKNAFVLADLPFGTYGTLQQAYDSCAALMRAGAQMIKIEGGAWLAETVRFLTDRGIPVCAHIGLTPQFVHQLGGYRVQGKTDEGAEQLKRELDCDAEDVNCVPRRQAAARTGGSAGGCAAEVGAEKAEQYVAQCQQVSPATHPPCNVANACSLMIDEIKRSCVMFDKDAPAFCANYR